jgi:hypothetical protein
MGNKALRKGRKAWSGACSVNLKSKPNSISNIKTVIKLPEEEKKEKEEND